MHTVASPDASTIAYDRCGDGPVVILVNGALGDRKLDRRFELMSGLAQLLAPDYTVINYDRRGRGASTEAGPFAMEREIEDVGAIGIPAPAVALMRLMPMWKEMAANAHTLPYDWAALGEHNMQGDPLEPAEWASVTMPALVVNGEKSPAGLQKGSQALAAVLPNARLEALQGVSHRLKVKVLAPVLAEFLGGHGENVRRGYGSTTAAQR